MNRMITPKELKAAINARSRLAILDVRRQNDLDSDSKKIPGAVWYDAARIAEWGGELPKDKDVVVYCARGDTVSNEVLDLLLSKGVNARAIEGGIEAWKKEGGQITER